MARSIHRMCSKLLAVGSGLLLMGTSATSIHAQSNDEWRLVGKSQYLSGINNSSSYDVRSVTTVGGVLYAATDDGIYEFTKGGWHIVGNSSGLGTGALIRGFSTLLATFGTSGVGFYDKGKWYQAGQWKGMNASPLLMVQNTLYVGTDKGVYSITANGINKQGQWTAIGASSGLSNVGLLAYLGGHLYADANGPAAQGTNDLYAYVDRKWRSVGLIGNYNSPLDVTSLMLLHKRLYAATSDGLYVFGKGPYTIATHGTWNQVALDGYNITSLVDVKGVLYAGTLQGGVLAEYGRSWSMLGSSVDLAANVYGSGQVHALAAIGNTLYAATEFGVYSYNISGQTAGSTLGSSGSEGGGSAGGSPPPPPPPPPTTP